MRKMAILGLGSRGEFWLKTALKSGWHAAGFDPDPSVLPTARRGEWRRENTISRTVKDADWIVCCLPERLELMQKVIQRAQAEAHSTAVIAVDTTFAIDELQSCALRPGRLVQIAYHPLKGVALSITSRNLPEIKAAATEILAQFAATLSLDDAVADVHMTSTADAKSA